MLHHPCAIVVSYSSAGQTVWSFLHISFQMRAACSSGCICNQPQDWETEDIFLNFLQEVEINKSRGAEHEFAFLKRLLRWAAVLKTVTVRFRPKLAVSEELCRKLISLCSPYSTCVKIYYYHNGCMMLYAPVNWDTRWSMPVLTVQFVSTLILWWWVLSLTLCACCFGLKRIQGPIFT